MTNWIFGLIGAAILLGIWWLLGAARERKRREELASWRRDRTGRNTLFADGPDRPVQREHAARSQPDRPEYTSSASVEHASTLPVSFASSDAWSSNDTCSPSSSDSSCDSGSSSSSSD
jgi:hypothetical protein